MTDTNKIGQKQRQHQYQSPSDRAHDCAVSFLTKGGSFVSFPFVFLVRELGRRWFKGLI